MTSPADGRIYLRLGYAVSKTQLLEVAMVKLLEALRQDLSQPLDDRWDEISEWLDLPAGRIKRRLGLPEAVAEDLHATIGRRNRVAHEAWLLYSLASDREASAETWAPWLDDEAAMFGEVTRGVALLAEFVREARAEGREVDAAGLERKWREDVPQPIAPRPDK
jgi:hypothetical protein